MYGTTTEAAIASSLPFRYRSYYYDTELGMYYLNTRYYDPNIGRFINADDILYLGANGDLQGFNLYAYCSNNPVMFYDSNGCYIKEAIKGVMHNRIKPLVDYGKNYYQNLITLILLEQA